jgi:peptidoglycan/LPS O-acetylase OafA/YrhL
VLVVVASHAYVPGAPSGNVGVTIFFCLSGFLITRLLLAEDDRVGRIDLRGFYARRIRRLYPALLVMTSVVLVFLAAGWADGFAHRTGVGALAAVAYSANWVAVVNGHDLGLLTHTWSLSVEEQFYLVWPPLLVAIAALHRGNRRPHVVLVGVLVGIMLAAAGWRVALISWGVPTLRLGWGTDTVAVRFAIGCLLAVVVETSRGHQLVRRWSPRLGPSAVVLLAASAALGDRWSLLVRVGYFRLVALATAVVIAWVLTHPSRLRTVLESPVLVKAGLISYGLYLWHSPIFRLLEERLDLAWPLLVPMQLSIAVAVAVASYRFVELPFLRRERTPAPEPSVA